MQQSVTGVYLETLVDGTLVHLRPIVVHLILLHFGYLSLLRCVRRLSGGSDMTLSIFENYVNKYSI